MVAIAAEAGVSRPTLYAHFKTVGEIVEAAVRRSVVESLAAIDAARPDEGPAAEALDRMAAASWSRLGRYEGLARTAGEHLSPGALHRTHAPIMARTQGLVERGRSDGTFRTDLPAEWLVTLFFTTVHAAREHALTHGMDGGEALAMARRTIGELFTARR